MESQGQQPRLRLAELVAALSLGIDLGFAQPMEHVLRQCLIALRLADRMALDESRRSAVYYAALLVNVGCHTDAHEQARWFGDDIALKAGKYRHGLHSVRQMASTMLRLGDGRPPIGRFRTIVEFALSGHREMDGMIEQHARMAQSLAEQLGLDDEVQRAVGSSYEQWDGKGWPGDLRGEAVPIGARLAPFAEFIEVAHRSSGIEAARALARERAGSQFDPAIAAVFQRDAEAILHGLDEANSWRAVIDAEPALAVVLADDEFDSALGAVADFVDLKSPYTIGHSRAVSELAAAAASGIGFPEADVRELRRAGLVHDFGRMGVSNAIWDKAGPLGAGERERIHFHPFLTERMLRQSAALAPLGEIALAHHERLDGSGYPRGLSGNAISPAARILAAADAYQTKREPRPYRQALSADEASASLRAEVRQGRLDSASVDAVLAAAGHRVPLRSEGVAGLTAREIEVLRLLARGNSNQAIATALVISPKTASNHIEHIYGKIGASNRAAASLFAVRQGLLPEL
jgi:HD-GYP domain-containing protein (c-di-GMP phosphodiesterase class II)